MPFINEIWNYKSLSIVGLEKNTGKTECLNYILSRIKDDGRRVALTSIGIDGEGIDQVTNTHKPEIELYENMLFVTSEKHYGEKRLTAEVLNVSRNRTSLGRLVTARVKVAGKVLISGPADTAWLQSLIDEMNGYSVDLTLVDGALSRLSLASPAVTQAMILTTGAALSANMSELVRKTAFAYTLIDLPEVNADLRRKLRHIDKGVWALDDEGGGLHDLNIPSALSINSETVNLLASGTTLFAAGAVGDKLLNSLRIQKQVEGTVLVIKDFSRAFFTPEAYNAFTRKGGKVLVLNRAKLLAVCVNPVSPSGYKLKSAELVSAMQANIPIPVYDIRQLE